MLKTHPKYTDYAITDDGRVWSKPRKDRLGRWWSGKWLKPGKASTGYYTVCLASNTKRKSFCLHQLVLETYVGPCPEGLQCRHLDGNRENNKLDNLRWGTPSENVFDAVRHGTAPGLIKGLKRKRSAPGNAKLNPSKVKEIKTAYQDGTASQQELAKA